MGLSAFGTVEVSLSKQVEQLCRQVNEEQDGDKLLFLVEQLNRELARISETTENAGVPKPSTSNSVEQNKPKAA
jgi:hypothetical protein